MKKLQFILFGVVCGLLASGLVLLISSPPRGVPITLSPPPTPSPLMVDVAGAVKEPGVYELPVGSRLQDAIQLAGGLLPDADSTAVNMAEKVIDGQKVIIPQIGEKVATRSESPATTSPTISQPLNINTASQTELESLPGIGPAKASAIIEYRTTNGPFASLEDLLEVSGIGEKICADIKELIVIQ